MKTRVLVLVFAFATQAGGTTYADSPLCVDAQTNAQGAHKKIFAVYNTCLAECPFETYDSCRKDCKEQYKSSYANIENRAAEICEPNDRGNLADDVRSYDADTYERPTYGKPSPPPVAAQPLQGSRGAR